MQQTLYSLPVLNESLPPFFICKNMRTQPKPCAHHSCCLLGRKLHLLLVVGLVVEVDYCASTQFPFSRQKRNGIVVEIRESFGPLEGQFLANSLSINCSWTSLQGLKIGQKSGPQVEQDSGGSPQLTRIGSGEGGH